VIILQHFQPFAIATVLSRGWIGQRLVWTRDSSKQAEKDCRPSANDSAEVTDRTIDAVELSQPTGRQVYHFIGSKSSIREAAAKLGRTFLQGIAAAERLFPQRI